MSDPVGITPNQYSSCSPSEITEALAQIGAAEAAIVATKLALIGAMEATRAYQGDGASSTSSWLQMRFGILASSARELVRVAKALGDLPETAATLDRGEISYDVGRFLTRFVTPETEAEILEEARGWSAGHARSVASRANPKIKEDSATAHEMRGLKLWWSDSATTLHLNGRFSASDGAVIEAAIEAITAHTMDSAPRDERPRWPHVRADALVEIASGALGGDPAKERPRVSVHVSYRDLISGEGSVEVGHGITEIESARRLLCDGVVQVMVDGDGRSVIGYGQSYRSAPSSLVRLVAYRDIHCQFPGCDRTRWNKVHHITYFSHGGPTDLENLTWLCHTHHRAVHEGGWKIRGSPSKGLEFIDPKGKRATIGPDPLRIDLVRRLEGMVGLKLSTAAA